MTDIRAATDSLTFNGTVSFGDLLTSASVLVAALTLYLSFAQSRVQRRRDVADAVRTAAADMLATLERYALLPKALSEHAQGLVVSVSQMVAGSSEPVEVEHARDSLWTGLIEAWETTRSAQHAEGVEKAHVRLYGHRPDAYDGVAHAIGSLDASAAACFDALLTSSQRVMTGYIRKDRTSIHSAQVGNELRRCLQQYDNDLEAAAAATLGSVRIRLQAIIAADDGQAADRAWRPNPLSGQESDRPTRGTS